MNYTPLSLHNLLSSISTVLSSTSHQIKSFIETERNRVLLIEIYKRIYKWKQPNYNERRW